MMEKQAFYDMLQTCFGAHGLEPFATPEHAELFWMLTRLMLEKNSVMNITAIREPERIIPLHYADCVLVQRFFPYGATVIDVGCGGGFPCLPLAIVRPDLTVTAIDSTEKKVRYVQETATTLGLRVTTVAARAEDLACRPEFRESFDVATSRAVARLNILDELCLPFVRVGGRMIGMKGSAGEEELREAERGIGILGGRTAEISCHDLLVLDEEVEKRTTVWIDKVAQTPAQYPRQFGSIKKKPL